MQSLYLYLSIFILLQLIPSIKYCIVLISNNSSASISDITLVNAFFEKIFWLIRDCYSEDDSRAMAFFGRLSSSKKLSSSHLL